MKKNVHIASSNINLSNRDYYESFDFFIQLGIKSAVLLHYNELPYISINNSLNEYNIYDKNKFPKNFFSKKLFKNPLNMNFSVCGIGNKKEGSYEKANIVFSTLINFECLYLRMMEICPLYIDKYFKGCSLIIDEADSILIDELTNGTIISRPIKTNCEEILKFVYQSRIQNKKAGDVFNEIKTKWPKCEDIRINDVLDMFQQIDLVNKEEFKNGKKYSIEPFENKEKINLLDIFRQANETMMTIKKKAKQGFKNLLSSKNSKSENINISFPKILKRKSNTFKQIIPFDYDHKGILEPNKEFGGFVQQFIAIKEILNNKNNENIIIKDISMNYLYVSHPIFISLYKGICGFTGTIGNKSDKQILKNHYNLITKKIPRKYSSRIVEFPIIVCDDIEERNNLIAAEVYEINKKDIPILIIFQDLNDIYAVFKILISIGIKNINIFDGKDENIKPDFIAGYKGSVSLGTNVCGRGTDIKNPYKPLHVIVSYFTSNVRVMKQSFGRTARHKRNGTSQIICLKDEFISSINIFNMKQINNILNDFQFKNSLQMEFIGKFRDKRPWIFLSTLHSQILTEDDISLMRETKINVNRINAFNYEYPICMSIPTFLLIQAQKIFSLYNCPNCKYTWMLFQKYLREMILESWSLFIEKIEKKYNELKPKTNFQNFMKLECNELYKWISLYLPESENEKNYDVVPTFMHIFNIVKNMYENRILSIFPENLTQCLKQIGKKRFCSFTFGFKPFSLIDESGSRINTMNGDEQQLTLIQDPELKYLQKLPKHSFSVISITEKIDGIFNMICQKINDIIGSYIGLRFFLRRTLGGCEFGVCYDFELENNEINILKEPNCLVDKDPLFVFTITVKSHYPVMAGILIVGLVYVASIAKSIIEWILTFPEKAVKELAKKTIKAVSLLVIDGQINSLCSSVCSFLERILLKQIEKVKEYKVNLAKLIHELLIITNRKDFAKSGSMINELFEGKTKLKINSDLIDKMINEHIPFHHFLKIGFLLMLCFASFMLNFHFHRQSVKYDSKKVSLEYDKKQDTDEALQKNQNLCQNEKMDKKNFEFKNNNNETENK